MQRYISLFVALVCVLGLNAKIKKAPQIVEIHDTIYIEVHDTIYVEVHDTVSEMLSMGVDGMPASDVYSDIWQNARVNPYNTPIDSLRQPVRIDISGFRLPHPGAVTSPYGMRKVRYHYGTDLRVAVGDSIHVAWDGVVRIVGWDPRGYGRYMVVRHDNGLETVYGHLSAALMDENERVFAGEVIALGGNTGRSTGPHLHWEMRYLGNAFNTAHIVDYEHGCARAFADNIYVLSKDITWPEYAQLKALKSAQWHTIKSGESLSTIARKYQTSVKAICRLNKINENTIIRAGKKIRVR